MNFHKRLSTGVWWPFARSNSSSVEQSPARSHSAMASPVANSHSQVNTLNGHKHPIANGAAASNGRSKPSGTSPSRLVELAHTITRETEKLDKYLRESGSAMPSFDVDAPMDFPILPEEMQRARQKVVETTKELGDLVVGPTEGVRWMAWDVSSLSSRYTSFFLKGIR